MKVTYDTKETYYTPKKDRYLFRGKSPYDTDTGLKAGDWITGSLELYETKDKNTGEMQCFHFIKPIDVMHVYDSYGGKRCTVEPWSVSQCTGLRDKNGTLVFIGDIVSCSRGCPHEVIWMHERDGMFIGGMPGVYLSGLKPGYAWTGTEEVVGNKWDNPELLENGGE